MSVILTSEDGTVLETFQDDKRRGQSYKITTRDGGIVKLSSSMAIDIAEAIMAMERMEDE